MVSGVGSRYVPVSSTPVVEGSAVSAGVGTSFVVAESKGLVLEPPVSQELFVSPLGKRGFASLNQEDYAKRFACAVSALKDGIGIRKDFLELLHEASQYRRKIAQLHGTPEACFFGVRRDTSAKTFVYVTHVSEKGRYGVYLERMAALSCRGGRIPRSVEKYGRSFLRVHDGHSFVVAEGGAVPEEVSLTECVVLVGDGERCGRVLHPASEEIPRALDTAAGFFDEAIKPGQALKDVLGHVARMHWWIAQSMPFCRGSAAVAEMMLKAVFSYHGIVWTPWRDDVMADMEAIVEPSCERYVEKFPSFFSEGVRYGVSL